MAKSKERLQACKLRKQGLSVKSIARKLGVSPGSVSLWCQGITLTAKQTAKLKSVSVAAGQNGRLAGAAKNKQQKIDAILRANTGGYSTIGKMSKRDLLVLASALYWAEGSKTGSRFVFVNSDPAMVFLMHRYLVEIEKVPPERLFLTVQINSMHEKRINVVLRYWSSLLGLPLQQFTKPYYVHTPAKKVYDNYNSYYGVARLGVRRGALLQYKILGYINALKSQK